MKLTKLSKIALIYITIVLSSWIKVWVIETDVRWLVITGFQRYAIRLTLAKFEGMGEVEVVSVGMAQLYRLGQSVSPAQNEKQQ